ncbi:hypothetical protein VC83_01060 [Pseudogymnoascus destructans]|uniref:DUF7820 domain-containing protein n=2 Tax=Pseudogymnoascus destructans TaxID=655981 RepID=L8G4S7_PSED2|nr:uncharacterized protein VC83_01060 [Pseudogymnoascus destructans]ELR07834.1 hypothetical protein GMDG_00455 [Pseudogymnoascus destructans 20631-21]OAF62553.1 hypothetical protein VC83_01060 [Pseudogymnoascus destructans]
MAPPDHQSSDVGRRESQRLSVRQSVDNTIDEGDDLYGLETMGVSDGFRPPHVQNHNRISSDSSQLNRSAPPRPPSISKPRMVSNFALRHDGAPESSSLGPPAERNESTDAPIIAPDGPYQGPTRPSHPYRMYSQMDRPARAASIATISSFPASEQSYSGPNGPTHPYGMYPQNTVPESEAGDIEPPANIPVGFPGLSGNQYQRRLGPDGEDAADIIGPDGHTEQLPPYTKYPDEVFARKLMPLSAPGPSAAAASGAGGIGLATRNPEFSSENLAISPIEPTSPRSTLSVRSGEPVRSRDAAAAAEAESEKPAEKKWKTMAKQKVCGYLPVWALTLIVLLIVVIALLVGNILGVMVTKRRDSKFKHSRPLTIPVSGDYYTTVTTTLDATPLPSLPTSLPTLPTGTFSLFMSSALESTGLCLENMSQLLAWSCDMPPARIQVTIANLGLDAPKTSNHAFSLKLPDGAQQGFSYGTQPPVFRPKNVMTLVSDYDDPYLGPAWFFQVTYDKVVILPAELLPAPSAKARTRRGNVEAVGDTTATASDAAAAPTSSTTTAPSTNNYSGGDGSGWPTPPGTYPRHSVVLAGSTPWFCYWNGTLLETFVYPNASSKASEKWASSYGASSTTASGYGRTSVPTDAGAVTAAGGTTTGTSGLLPPYPKVVKIEERRMPRGAYDQPYCVQMRISADRATAAPVRGADGSAVVVMLDERVGASGGSKAERDGVEMEKRMGWGKRGMAQECHCGWVAK